MDLGCLDLGCISLSDEKRSEIPVAESSIGDSSNSLSTTTKPSKNKLPRDSPPSGGNALNRVTSQIKKPLHRKTSPLNWFPRKKVDSYLKRKIKVLQEAGGMNNSLDETLGHANPHYCRVEREKRAAREAAYKVMEARKAAMVEASWCRILQAARISNKEADAQLLEAEKEVSEAFEAAKSKGVIMYDTPEDFEMEISCTSVKGSTTHAIRASFETAFEVDKQVAAAVKAAFIKLAHYEPFNKDEFKDLLRKINENPDSLELSESDTGLKFESGSCNDGPNSNRKNRKKQSPQKFKGTFLVNMMLERLKCLKEQELASLATIVATCGLNAALADNENHRMHNKFRASSGMDYTNGSVRKDRVGPDLPSLDKFLVKKLTKLEKEVQEAKNARKAESINSQLFKGSDKVESAPDLGSVLINKHSSRLEKEIQEAKRNQQLADNGGAAIGRTLKHGKSRLPKQDDLEVPSLDKVLLKHVSRLQKEVEEAKNARKAESERGGDGKSINSNNNVPDLGSVLIKHSSKLEKEIQESKRNQNLAENDGSEAGRTLKHGKSRLLKQDDTEIPSLDKVLVKHVSRLEKEVQEAKNKRDNEFHIISGGGNSCIQSSAQEQLQKENINMNTNPLQREQKQNVEKESLDSVLVKHVSRLEKEKMAFVSEESVGVRKRDIVLQTDTSLGGLDQILVKPKSRVEREKTIASEQPEVRNTYSKSRREARERELLETWGGMGLGNSMRPHVSRLERDKAAWIKAEEEEKQAELHT
ncbi:uncharacterized protein LOC130824343 [Amaranthus tricolor]|uniref:uncharacterized protein LOC130824343 n=1 Tax=Amaranthus tricolor TaxID=29722 RepID=UPI00258C5CA7|nr:uncharacterized protein LOC130824343 [Amaranthus tricolor]